MWYAYLYYVITLFWYKKIIFVLSLVYLPKLLLDFGILLVYQKFSYGISVVHLTFNLKGIATYLKRPHFELH